MKLTKLVSLLTILLTTTYANAAYLYYKHVPSFKPNTIEVPVPSTPKVIDDTGAYPLSSPWYHQMGTSNTLALADNNPSTFVATTTGCHDVYYTPRFCSVALSAERNAPISKVNMYVENTSNNPTTIYLGYQVEESLGWIELYTKTHNQTVELPPLFKGQISIPLNLSYNNYATHIGLHISAMHKLRPDGDYRYDILKIYELRMIK